MAQSKVHVKKGDTVLVLTGKDAGKRGKILEVNRKKQRLIVEGVNITKKHNRPTQAMPQGGILEKEGLVASSNVMLVCPKCEQPTRIAKKLIENKYRRACRRCGELIDS